LAYQPPQLLIEELVKRKILTQESADEVSRESASNQKEFGEVLITKNLISDSELLKIKAEIYQLPIVDLAVVEVDRELVKDIPDNIISLYKILPISTENSVLKVAIINPEDIAALEAVKFIASDRGLNLEKYLISYKDFSNVSKNLKTLTSEVGRVLESLPGDERKQLEISDKTAGLDQITAEAPITRVVAAIVKHAVETRASDIHIEPFEDRIRLRFRIDGVLQTVLSLPTSLLSALATRIKILSDLKIDEIRLAQDGRFSTKINDRKVDFRVSTFPTRNGEKVVLRILDPMVGDINLIDLGLEGRSLDLVRENIKKPFGEILITGPTGSGKSTTLAAILREVNSDEVNIVTLEDPIEYYVNGVNQSQTHEEIGYTFASGLRHILRQDPDIIMVGEIRDGETASLATQASLTGHVVLSTLHTNDTIGVIPRLIDMGVEKYLLAPTLNLALAQRLARKLCQFCKVAVKASTAEEFSIKKALDRMPKESKKGLGESNFEIFKAGDGCKECNGKSYKGRIGVFETLAMTDELEKIILTNISEEDLRKEAKNQGMITMFEDGIIKVIKGLTSMEELLTVAQEVEAGEPEK